MKNTGKPYEALAEQVFRRLLAQGEVCADVQRDTQVLGKSGTSNQIDVSFVFIVGGIKYLTIVQCKDWTSHVKKEHVLTFKGVLDDIPGQPRGILVSRSGFQAGAREYAAHHGIQLYELREPRDEDWDGLIRTLRLDFSFEWPEFRVVKAKLDEKWLQDECKRLGIGFTGQKFQIRQDPSSIATESGGTCDLRRELSYLIPDGPCDWTLVHHEFSSAVMLKVTGSQIPLVRATAIDVEIRVVVTEESRTIPCDHLVAYCFRDVLTGEARFLDRDGSTLGHKADEVDT